MNSSLSERSSEVFDSICDQFQIQSRGRLQIVNSSEIFDLDLDALSARELRYEVREWIDRFEKSPKLRFYRGNFFWEVSVEDGRILASLFKRHPGGGPWREKPFVWRAASANPERVVKNLLDIMKNLEKSLAKKKAVA